MLNSVTERVFREVLISRHGRQSCDSLEGVTYATYETVSMKIAKFGLFVLSHFNPLKGRAVRCYTLPSRSNLHFNF